MQVTTVCRFSGKARWVSGEVILEVSFLTYESLNFWQSLQHEESLCSSCESSISYFMPQVGESLIDLVYFKLVSAGLCPQLLLHWLDL